MLNLTLELYEAWKKHLIQVHPTDSHCICAWLLSGLSDRIDSQSSYDMMQCIDYRYRTLKKRYLNQSQQQAYRNLIIRLFVVVNQHPFLDSILQPQNTNKSELINLIQDTIEHLINENDKIRKNIAWVGKLTNNSSLREALTLASLEEYCCQLVNGQPRIIYHLCTFSFDSSELIAA